MSELEQLCGEIRTFIIDQVSKNGGHFAANLGVVELTVALHFSMNTPHDQLIWDVGHQAYSHKILTGRRSEFESNRRLNGLSGFPKRAESEFDAFGVGHSSTSVSAAMGFAEADQLLGVSRKHVVVIGDGALTAGQAFEALNHLGHLRSDVLVIVNDNQIAIDQTIGALQNRFDEDFFKALDLPYQGPIDGHHLPQLIDAIQTQLELTGPRILHVKTVKGKGYEPAEKDQTTWHSPGLFDKLSGIRAKSSEPQPPAYQDVFGLSLVELADMNDSIVAITPAMPTGSGLVPFMQKFPNRFFDTGITEQHAGTFAAGLAANGATTYMAYYSTFLQRGYDQLIHDVAIQNLPVIFCIDRAGLVGEDGPTHHGAFDLAFLRCIPNMIVAAPSSASELRNLLFSAPSWKSPVAIRYPRGKANTLDWRTSFKNVELGKGKIIQQSTSNLAILSIGTMLEVAEKAAQISGKSLTIADFRFVKPLDEALLKQLAETHSTFITLEDGCLNGGFGSAIIEWLVDNGYSNKVVRVGIPDQFIQHGSIAELRKICGMDADHVASLIEQHISE